MGENVTARWAALRWPAVLLAGVLAVSACSSGPSSTLSDEQRTALGEVAAAFDAAEAELRNAFAPEVVVPNLERWQEAETVHQEALAQLVDALPEGECRAAVEALVAVEEGQNAIRLRLIENYRQEQFSLVSDDTVEYGRSVVNGAVQAEGAVLAACGRSTVDPAQVTGAAATLTPVQNERFEAVLTAYAATGAAFDAAFTVSEFLADLRAVQAADAAVATELNDAVTSLGDGACRTALGEVQALEQQQADLRAATIAAGEAGDLVTMFRTLGEYNAVDAASEPFTTARQAAVDACGADV